MDLNYEKVYEEILNEVKPYVRNELQESIYSLFKDTAPCRPILLIMIDTFKLIFKDFHTDYVTNIPHDILMHAMIVYYLENKYNHQCSLYDIDYRTHTISLSPHKDLFVKIVSTKQLNQTIKRLQYDNGEHVYIINLLKNESYRDFGENYQGHIIPFDELIKNALDTDTMLQHFQFYNHLDVCIKKGYINIA